MTNDEVLYLAKESDVKFVRLQFTDLFGQLKNVAIMIDRLPQALEGCYMFDGSSIDGFARIEESDMYLKPDADTFSVFPWRPQAGRVARLICDVQRPDGSAFDGDPRHILRRAVEEAEKLGYRMMVGQECEFFLFHTDDQGKPTTSTHDEGGYFDLGPVDLGEDARRDICMALEELGFEVEASHHEVAPGQHEIDFNRSHALKAADDMMTFRLTVKAIAKRHGLAATFMPKPIEGIWGSGLHVMLSLWKGDMNCFAGNGPEGLSETAGAFAAGVMGHIGAVTALTNPLVNSYKRLVPGYEAPVFITWAAHNQGALIRVPAAGDQGARLELRSPDPSCNPYLAFAAILTAGIDGIKKGFKAPAMVETDLSGMTPERRGALGIGSLPASLEEGLNALEKDDLILGALGAHAAEQYLRVKRLEWQEYSRTVHQWEVDKYLARF
jgi:glutamine synthetase